MTGHPLAAVMAGEQFKTIRNHLRPVGRIALKTNRISHTIGKDAASCGKFGSRGSKIVYPEYDSHCKRFTCCG